MLFVGFMVLIKQKKLRPKSINRHKVVLVKTLCPVYGLKVFYKNIATGHYVHLWTKGLAFGHKASVK